jgi:transcriptional regulator of acetoin/glycerol metabolism
VNVLRVAIAIADGEDVQVWHLPEDFLAEFEASSVEESDPPIPEQSVSGLELQPEDTLARTLQIYRKCTGNVSQAARELAISRNTLYKRLRELGVR